MQSRLPRYADANNGRDSDHISVLDLSLGPMEQLRKGVKRSNWYFKNIYLDAVRWTDGGGIKIEFNKWLGAFSFRENEGNFDRLGINEEGFDCLPTSLWSLGLER